MPIRIGTSKAFLEFLVALAIIGLFIGFGTRAWDYWLAIGSLAVLAIATPLALHMAWRKPGRPVYPVSLLPRKWRRWASGESGTECNDCDKT